MQLVLFSYRKAQAAQEVNWDEYRAEEEHRERMRKQDEARRKGPYSNDIHIFWEIFKPPSPFGRIHATYYYYSLLLDYPLLSQCGRHMSIVPKASAGSAVQWDDAEERRCQQRYRKKYSHH